jgi:hypothetical protein
LNWINISLKVEHFIKTDPLTADKKWITTELLPSYFAAWLERETHLSQQLSDIQYEL